MRDVEGPDDPDDPRGGAAGREGPWRSNRSGHSEVIEEALRRQLGFDLLERLWQNDDLGEEDAATAVEAQHETRRRRR